jgi:hypothetical protein
VSNGRAAQDQHISILAHDTQQLRLKHVRHFEHFCWRQLVLLIRQIYYFSTHINATAVCDFCYGARIFANCFALWELHHSTIVSELRVEWRCRYEANAQSLLALLLLLFGSVTVNVQASLSQLLYSLSLYTSGSPGLAGLALLASL